jgi:hypothetical protein
MCHKSFTIINYASVWSITYDRNLRNRSFMVLGTVITIKNYDCKTFKVQATGDNPIKLFWHEITDKDNKSYPR